MAKKRVRALLTIRVSLSPGICRWCRCTYDNPCANGCAWADRYQTLCTACVPLDEALETAKGRRELAAFVQEYAPEGPTVYARFQKGRQPPRVPRATRLRRLRGLRHAG
jgi:hypothetical protein